MPRTVLKMSLSNVVHHFLSRSRARFARVSRQQTAIAVVAGILLVAALSSALSAVYRYRTNQAHYAAMLAVLWGSYKRHDWDAATGRTIDVQNGGITTSEGQAYTLMRAVWMNDRPTFDKTWRWTADHLQRRDDLFSWRWGALPNGSVGIQTSRGGNNTASDADTDIAVALLMAAVKWNRSDYAAAARKIVLSIWEAEVVVANGQPYMAADDLEKTSSTPYFVANPSYIAPYAYRMFAREDTQHDWQQLARNSYTFLAQADSASLGGGVSAGLPPSWVRIDKTSGAIEPPNTAGVSTDFGYDAFRMYWRIGLDERWYGVTAARQLLMQSSFLADTWQHQKKIAAVYSHAGKPKVSYESLALYGGSLAYFDAVNRSYASAVVTQKIDPWYDAHTHRLRLTLSYYDNNWVWFGLAYEQSALPNIAAGDSP